MKQPPNPKNESSDTGSHCDHGERSRAPLQPSEKATPPSVDQTLWRRPRGVAPGTWRYALQGTIASRYDAFVADTPLCQLDQEILRQVFPTRNQAGNAAASGASEAERPSTGIEAGDSESLLAKEKKWVLDLGCGTGRAAWVLSEAGYDVLAIDLSVKMQEQMLAKSIPNVHPIQANLVELSGIASGVADGAICLFSTFGMIQGREHRREMLRHVGRIMKPDSPLLLHAHHRYSSLKQAGGLKALLHSGWRAWTVKGCEFGDATYAYRGLPDMFLHRFSHRELVQDFQATGWRVSETMRLSLDGVSVLPPTVASRLRVAGGFMIVAHSTAN